eukprot:101137-Chlamydomonas_euryale.AAC.2
MRCRRSGELGCGTAKLSAAPWLRPRFLCKAGWAGGGRQVSQKAHTCLGGRRCLRWPPWHTTLVRLRSRDPELRMCMFDWRSRDRP